MVGHRDVPGKPELLGTTREFLDYFSLKKLDDLPTLAQLKELEDLRVQLTLPGADPEVAIAPDAQAEAGTDADTKPDADTEPDAGPDNSDDEETDSAGALDADSDSPRPHGLVASGSQDDPN